MSAMLAIDRLRTLVAFDTTSRNSNLALVDWVVRLLDEAGARIRLTYDDARAKANVLASFGPDVPGGVLLSAHTDVVPVDGQVWSCAPFELTERDGRLYGRGTADMKGFVACCLAAVPSWAKADLNRPIHLALSYDEEVGCFGVPRLIADLAAHVPKPAVAIVGEPTGMMIADHHRGYLGFRTTFRGLAAHSSDPGKGVSAICAAAQFVRRLERLQAQDADGTTRTTFNVGQISGGTGVNIVPSHCDVVWEIRPAADADLLLLKNMADKLVFGAARPEFRPETQETITIPPLRPEPGNPASAVARLLGAAPTNAGLPFGTEGGFFQNAGIPTIVCGPGSIEQAHQADEWVAIDQLEQASRFLNQMTQWAAA
jgi:acetylornithine deacetylase